MNEFSQPKLLQTKYDYFFATFFLLLILTFTLSYHYEKFLLLKAFTWQEIQASVLSEKIVNNKGKTYVQLELQSGQLHFYTQAKEALRDLTGHTIFLVIYTDKINFYDYLTSFFAYSKLLEVDRRKSSRYHLIEKVHTYHTNPLVANLYGALFFVEPISKQLRIKLSSLGVNHLAALSGFHLGLLAVLSMFLIKRPYKILQQRFFPYRSANNDTIVLMLAILFVYVAFLDLTPSLLRSYGMLLIGAFLYNRGLALTTQSTLFLAVLILLALFPYLLFSLGFWFSVMGVSMIISVLHLFKRLQPLYLFIIINSAVFMLMSPLSLAVFKNISMTQLLSPLLSIAFIVFYPLSIFLHLLGFGESMDGLLISLFEIAGLSRPFEISLLFISLYMLLFALTLRYKQLYSLLLITALCFTLIAYFSFL